MKKEELAKYLDYTILKQDVRNNELMTLCENAKKYNELKESVKAEKDAVEKELEALKAQVDPSLMEKYLKKRQKKFTQRRYFGDDSEHVCAGVKEFLAIQKKYGGEFYAALGWENKDYQYQLDLAKDIYNAGAEKLISWNANHIVRSGSKLQGVKACGDKEKILKGESKVVSDNFRILSLNGNDISEFDPNWRG